MLIFNITFLVSDQVASKWKDWVHAVHIPFMMESGCFSKPQVAKVLTDHGQDGTSYSVQYHAADMINLEQWQQQHGEQMQQECNTAFGQEVLLFTTVLELLQ